jgi:hypothetical protein
MGSSDGKNDKADKCKDSQNVAQILSETRFSRPSLAKKTTKPIERQEIHVKTMANKQFNKQRLAMRRWVADGQLWLEGTRLSLSLDATDDRQSIKLAFPGKRRG